MWYLKSDWNWHSVLSIFSWFWVVWESDQWLKQTIYVIYYTELILGTFGNLPVNKSDTMSYLFQRLILSIFGNLPVIKSDTMLDFSLSWFRGKLIIDMWLHKTLCVRYFTELIWGTFGNWPVNKVYTMC